METKVNTFTLVIFTIILLFMACGDARSQELALNGSVYSEVSKPKPVKEQKLEKTGFDYKDKQGKVYPIYIGKTGSCFTVRKSQKTGREYKKYLEPEYSKQICQKLGREYKPKKTNN